RRCAPRSLPKLFALIGIEHHRYGTVNLMVAHHAATRISIRDSRSFLRDDRNHCKPPLILNQCHGHKRSSGLAPQDPGPPAFQTSKILMQVPCDLLSGAECDGHYVHSNSTILVYNSQFDRNAFATWVGDRVCRELFLAL